MKVTIEASNVLLWYERKCPFLIYYSETPANQTFHFKLFEYLVPKYSVVEHW